MAGRTAYARLTAAALLPAALLLVFARPAASQIPPSVELRVPKAPTHATGDAGSFLAYELHVTNLTGGRLRITRIDVVAGSGSAAVHTLSDSALVRAVARPGVQVLPPDRPLLDGGMRAIVYLWIPLESGETPRALRHRVTVARENGDGGAVVLEGAPTPVHPTAPVIGPPLRGEWVAVNGPSNASGHRRLVLALNGRLASAQRFGMDLVQIDDEGRTSTGDRLRNDSHYAYGRDVLAVADGIVVETKDGIPENVPGPDSRAVPITLETVSGNSVVIDIGDGRYAFYAHLIPGSLRVAEGDRVRRGDVIGRVGNSGNSTEPHLHFHVVDGLASGTSTLGAEGVPYALERFEVIGRCTNFGRPCDRITPLTVRGGIPLQNQFVRFPD